MHNNLYRLQCSSADCYRLTVLGACNNASVNGANHCEICPCLDINLSGFISHCFSWKLPFLSSKMLPLNAALLPQLCRGPRFHLVRILEQSYLRYEETLPAKMDHYFWGVYRRMSVYKPEKTKKKRHQNISTSLYALSKVLIHFFSVHVYVYTLLNKISKRVTCHHKAMCKTPKTQCM